MAADSTAVQVEQVPVNDVVVNVALAGDGPPVLLLHGWPHTWQVWTPVIAALAAHHRCIAPDLRGLGGTTRTAGGYDAAHLARDAAGLLDALGEQSAAVVAIDAGVAPAFLLAMSRPERVRRLVLVEALVGRLPGAEDFLAAGPPWWFGFHAVPGLAESVLPGGEAAYVDWFLRAGTGGRGVDPAIRDAFVTAYTGPEALRAGFEHYRAMPTSAEQIASAVAASRLTVPTMAVGAGSVGAATHAQLQPVADELVGHVIEDCGHIVPLDRPDRLLDLLQPFLG